MGMDSMTACSSFYRCTAFQRSSNIFDKWKEAISTSIPALRKLLSPICGLISKGGGGAEGPQLGAPLRQTKDCGHLSTTAKMHACKMGQSMLVFEML